MTLSALVRALLRRWYIAVVGLIVTGLLAFAALNVVEPEYDAAGSILLLPPTVAGANPYLDLAAVPGVPEVVSRVLHDSKYADKYDDAGIKDYEVSPDQSAGGPAVLVIGKGSSEGSALKAMNTVMADVLPVLQELQDEAGVEAPNLITGRQIYVETEATKVGKKQTRAVIVAVGAGLVGTLFLVIAFDVLLAGLATRRRNRSDQQRPPAQSTGPGDGPPTDGPGRSEAPAAPVPTASQDPESSSRPVRGPQDHKPKTARAPESSAVSRSGRPTKRTSRSGSAVPATDSD